MNRTPLFTGVATALVTPFTHDNQIDEQALGQLVERQTKAGVPALVPCGSTGEAATLTPEEQKRVIRIVVEAANGHARVIAGTGSNSTAEAIELTLAARDAGADGALLISPYYVRPMQHGIVDHFRAVAAAVSGFPLIVYDIPGRTGVEIETATMVELAKIPNVVGLKEATGSVNKAMNVIAACGSDLLVCAGDDSLTLPMIAIGGAGVISVLSNLLPEAFVGMMDHLQRGNFEKARVVHYHMLPLIRALFLETNPIPVKAALHMMGLCNDRVRLPLTPMSARPRRLLERELKKLDLL